MHYFSSTPKSDGFPIICADWKLWHDYQSKTPGTVAATFREVQYLGMVTPAHSVLYYGSTIRGESYYLAFLERPGTTMACVEAMYRDRPTNDARAAALWRWSNSTVTYDLAAEVMRHLGYVPFQGFPLTRSKPWPTDDLVPR